MKLIKPSFSIWEQEPGLQGIYKQVEKAAKVCYKSEGNITEDSAKPFIDNVLLKRHHYSPLEHGTVYLNIHWEENVHEVFEDMFKFYTSNPYSKIVRKIINKEDLCPDLFISTNYRVLVEHNRLKDLEYLCEPTEYHAKRITVYFTCDRVTGESFLRHRVFSFARESTRYCNYSKDKFGNELTFIEPCWIKDNQDTNDRWCFYESLSKSEEVYFRLLKHGWKPQQARVVLPFAVKSPLVMTGFVDDWWGEYSVIDKATGLIDQRIHGKFYGELNNIDRDKYRVVEKGFFPLRCSSGAHSQAQELAIPLRQEFINKKIW